MRHQSTELHFRCTAVLLFDPPQHRQEILDWFHLVEKLHKVGGSLKRLAQAKALLWQGQVEQSLALFEGLKSVESGGFASI